MRKYLITMGVLFCVLFTCSMLGHQVGAQSTNGNRFSDVKEADWFKENVDILVQDSRGIVKGYPDGTFKPQGSLTADQFITMVVRATGFSAENGKDYWAKPFIDQALLLGFVKDKEFTTYTSKINREQMSRILVRVAEYLEGSKTYTKSSQVLSILTDKHTLTYALREDVLKSYELGLIGGYTDYSFRPQGILTRAEASTVIVRVIKPEKRLQTDYDKILEALDKQTESQLKGGVNWKDPIGLSVRENMAIDRSMIRSDMEFSPTLTELAWSGNMYAQSKDMVMGLILYDEKGAKSGQVEDFGNILRRRLSEKDAASVMVYLNKKKDVYTFLQEEEKVFYFDKYVIRLKEVIAFPMLPKFKQASMVDFNIWFIDKFFDENFKGNL